MRSANRLLVPLQDSKRLKLPGGADPTSREEEVLQPWQAFKKLYYENDEQSLKDGYDTYVTNFPNEKPLANSKKKTTPDNYLTWLTKRMKKEHDLSNDEIKAAVEKYRQQKRNIKATKEIEEEDERNKQYQE